MDTFLNWLAFGGLGYLAGAGMHWWPGPIAFMKSRASRMKDRRSGALHDGDEADNGDFMNEPDDPPGFVRLAPKRLQLPVGPRPLDDLRRDYGLDDEDDDDQDDDGELPEHRIEWVAQALTDRDTLPPGRRPKLTQIDEEGARLYGVTTRTIAGDRAALAKRGQGGTMRGPRR